MICNQQKLMNALCATYMINLVKTKILSLRYIVNMSKWFSSFHLILCLICWLNFLLLSYFCHIYFVCLFFFCQIYIFFCEKNMFGPNFEGNCFEHSFMSIFHICGSHSQHFFDEILRYHVHIWTSTEHTYIQ